MFHCITSTNDTERRIMFLSTHSMYIFRLLSVHRSPPFSKILFSETDWPIKAKFYMKHLRESGTSVFINNLGHMTKMAAMPILGKTPFKKISSPEPVDRNLACSIWA